MRECQRLLWTRDDGVAQGDALEQIPALVEAGTTFHPKAEDAEVYDRLYPVYDKIYHALADQAIFEQIASFQEKS